MADVMTVDQRSRLMSRVRSKNTKPEKWLRSALWHSGGRYRLGMKLPGKPDLAFTRSRIAVFVDGCFWHCCPEHGSIPHSNREFWEKKLAANVERDNQVNKSLKKMGWRVIRFWEHDVEKDVYACAEFILKVHAERS